MEERVKLPVPLLIGILVAIIAVCGFFAFKASTPAVDNRTFKDPPELAWVKQKSQEVKGDWSKFTPAEQARADAATSGRGAMSVAIYGKGKAVEGNH